MIAEILSTGDEVRTGAIVDSNAAHIARELEANGAMVIRHTCIGDDISLIAEALKEIAGRTDAAVVTGGLGPTHDDLTAEAAALAADVKLESMKIAMDAIERYFKDKKYPMSPSNRKMALLPKGVQYLENPVGTAPGFCMKMDRCSFFFLPGVPVEMKRMLKDTVLGAIRSLPVADGMFYKTKTITTFGMMESAMGETLAGLTDGFQDIRLGLRAKFPEIQVKLYAKGEDSARMERDLKAAEEKIVQHLGTHVISRQGEDLEAAVGELLKGRQATISVAESCTGGLISHLLTNVAGSSAYFLFASTTYSNSAKKKVLGVCAETLDRFGAVSEETVKEMAQGVRQLAGADYGLATSGIAGPDGGTAEKPVGTVWIGLAGPDFCFGRKYCFAFKKRNLNKRIFAVTALDLLRRTLINGAPKIHEY